MMLMIPKSYATRSSGTAPSSELVAKMRRYSESLSKAGILLALDGLYPPTVGVRLTFSGGRPAISEGPFAGSSHALGGYWMIQAQSREEAIEWARRCPAAEGDVIEIRQVHEASDLPPLRPG